MLTLSSPFNLSVLQEQASALQNMSALSCHSFTRTYARQARHTAV